MTKLRIRPLNELNWVTERLGRPQKGRASPAGKEGWHITGYYPTLRTASVGLLDDVLQDEWTGKDIAEAVERAETRVLEAVEAARG